MPSTSYQLAAAHATKLLNTASKGEDRVNLIPLVIHYKGVDFYAGMVMTEAEVDRMHEIAEETYDSISVYELW